MWIKIGLVCAAIGSLLFAYAAFEKESKAKMVIFIIIAVLCTCGVYYAPFGYQEDKAKDKQESKKSDSIDLSVEERRKIVTDIVEALQPKLSERHRDGYATFGIAKEGFLVPFGYIHPGFDIDWKTGGVTSVTETYVEGVLPNIKTKYFLMSNNKFKLTRGIGSNIPVLEDLGVCLDLEVVSVYRDITVVALYTYAAARE